jgi:hypothetical protein
MDTELYDPADFLGQPLRAGRWVVRTTIRRTQPMLIYSRLLEVSGPRRQVRIQSFWKIHGDRYRACKPAWTSRTDRMVIICDDYVPVGCWSQAADYV